MRESGISIPISTSDLPLTSSDLAEFNGIGVHMGAISTGNVSVTDNLREDVLPTLVDITIGKLEMLIETILFERKG